MVGPLCLKNRAGDWDPQGTKTTAPPWNIIHKDQCCWTKNICYMAPSWRQSNRTVSVTMAWEYASFTLSPWSAVLWCCYRSHWLGWHLEPASHLGEEQRQQLITIMPWLAFSNLHRPSKPQAQVIGRQRWVHSKVGRQMTVNGCHSSTAHHAASSKVLIKKQQPSGNRLKIGYEAAREVG